MSVHYYPGFRSLFSTEGISLLGIWKTEPFVFDGPIYQTALDHSNTRLVHCSDPHCEPGIFNITNIKLGKIFVYRLVNPWPVTLNLLRTWMMTWTLSMMTLTKVNNNGLKKGFFTWLWPKIDYSFVNWLVCSKELKTTRLYLQRYLLLMHACMHSKDWKVQFWICMDRM